MSRKILNAGLILLLGLSSLSNGLGQCPDQINFFDQKSIDLFPVNFPGCTKIKFHVSIYGGGSDPVTDLTGLSGLEVIGGNFRIYQTSIHDLKGLENLDTVYKDFSIEYNSLLEDLEEITNIKFIGQEFGISGNHGIHKLDTFHHLTRYETLSIFGNDNLTDISSLSIVNTIEKGLFISNNPRLKSLYGLHEIDTVGETLRIWFSDSLTSLLELSGLKYVGHQIEIKGNDLIQDLSGLENIRGDSLSVIIEGNDELIRLIGFPQTDKVYDLEIRSNDKLDNLEGLTGLHKIEGSFRFENNDLFSNLSGLDALEYINGELRLASNAQLTSIDQLQNLSPDSLFSLSIVNNPLLSACNTDFICSSLKKIEIPAEVYGNGDECYTFHELVKNCGIQECVSHYVFRSQAEIDEFPSTLPLCTILPGDLVIEEREPGAILNVDSLRQFVAIFGSLCIKRNAELVNLSGLHNLEIIGKSFQVVENGNLQSFSGIDNLTSVGGHLEISDNPSLISFQGLDSLASIGGNFSLTENPLIQSIQNLSNLTNIDSSFTIASNQKLQTLEGLDNLQAIQGDISIYKNDALTNLSNLSGLNQVGAGVYVYQNNSLDSLDFLNSEDTINGSIIINSNPALIKVNAFRNALHVKGEIEVRNNPALTNFAAFQKVEWVGENVLVNSNPLLTGLHEFNQLAFVGGTMQIYGCGIQSMSGLNNLRSVGRFSIFANDSLVNIDGLENLEHVGLLDIGGENLENLDPLTSLLSIGELWISGCPKLRHLPLLDKVDFIDGLLDIAGNDLLSDLSGLDSIQRVNGGLDIWFCPSLKSLKGLENLKQCGGTIYIASNDSLLHLNELEQLTNIDGLLRLVDNASLVDIDGIRNLSPEGIHPSSGSESNIAIEIRGNPNLTSCAIGPVCDLLSERLSEVFIRNNSDGCNSPIQVIVNCDLPNSCHNGGLIISRQEQIDDFSVNNIGCSFLNGDLVIHEEVTGNITNLNGLAQLKSIGGSLTIEHNSNLELLAGLDSLKIIGGVIKISNNGMLYSISALENINPSYINTQSYEENHFIINDNVNLSVCSVQPLCSLLVDPKVKVIVDGNGNGCTDKQEAISGCGFPTECTLGTIRDQKTIDEFPVRYPGCTELTGSLFLFRSPNTDPSDPIISLAPLSQLTTLNGGLSIRNIIGLTDLGGLENLRDINGPLEIRLNPGLVSLEAIKDLKPESILTSVQIFDNISLTECAVNSICHLLEDNEISIGIADNAPDCNSINEVLANCLVPVVETSQIDEVKIYPNPTTGMVQIEPGPGVDVENAIIEIYDLYGRQIRSLGFDYSISIGDIGTGLYLFVIRTQNLQDYYSRILVTD